MAPPNTWETIAFFALGIIVLLWFRPGIKAALGRSRQARERDWRAVAMALAAVVLFVLLLIVLARSTSSQRGPEPGFSDAVISWQRGHSLIKYAGLAQDEWEIHP